MIMSKTDTFIFHRRCVKCDAKKTFNVNRKGYLRWLKGDLIQNAMPELSSDQREMIISGICEHCWEEMYGDI